MQASSFLRVLREHQPVLSDIGAGKFGAQLVRFPPTHMKGVLKYAQFATDTTRGVPKSEMHNREVAVYHLDRDVLHFGIVPPAHVVRLGGKVASISEYVDGLLPRQMEPGLFDKDKDDWKVKLAKLWARVDRLDALKIVLLDLIINNADRHGRNWLIVPPHRKLVAIDNGMSFAPFFQHYRSVIHRYLFLHKLEVPDTLVRKLRSVTRDQIAAAIGPFVGKKEVEHTWLRLQFVLEHLKHLDFHTLSQGDYDKNGFPSYAAWFRKQMAKPALSLDGLEKATKRPKPSPPGWKWTPPPAGDKRHMGTHTWETPHGTYHATEHNRTVLYTKRGAKKPVQLMTGHGPLKNTAHMHDMHVTGFITKAEPPGRVSKP